MKDKIRLSWGQAAAYNLPSAILIGHLSRKKMLLSKTASKKERKKEAKGKHFHLEVTFKKKNPPPFHQQPLSNGEDPQEKSHLYCGVSGSLVGGGAKFLV